MLGGEHSLSAGSVSAARKHFGANLALLWIDAHADINTPSTSSSGNAHGMPIAALLGLPSGTTGTRDQEWKQFTDLVATGLEASRVSWMALRDVDSGERNVIRQFANSLPLTMQDIDRYGIERCVERFDAWLVQQGSEYLWISFDVDALDPILAPGTGTAVRGGLSYREAHLMAELLFEKLSRPDCPYKLVGLDLVEVNPLTDTNNETARIAVEWLASLFGKTVLDPSH
jgi:arginase